MDVISLHQANRLCSRILGTALQSRPDTKKYAEVIIAYDSILKAATLRTDVLEKAAVRKSSINT